MWNFYFHLLSWLHPIPKNHDLHKLESTLPEDAFKNVSAFMTKSVSEKRILNYFSLYIAMQIFDPPHCGLPYPRESWLKKKLPKDVSQMFPLLWPIGFWEEVFLKHFLYICHCVKIWPLIVRHLTPGDHDLNKLESTLHDDVSTQVTAFLVGRFLRIIYPTPDTVFIYLLINPIYSSVVIQ